MNIDQLDLILLEIEALKYCWILFLLGIEDLDFLDSYWISFLLETGSGSNFYWTRRLQMFTGSHFYWTQRLQMTNWISFYQRQRIWILFLLGIEAVDVYWILFNQTQKLWTFNSHTFWRENFKHILTVIRFKF